MAKRTRGTHSPPNRPGARPANTAKRTTARPVSAPLAPAQPMPSEVGASILMTEAVEAGLATQAQPVPAVARSTPGRPKVKPNSLLAAKAETEYVYVGRDLRRIATVGASLFGILIALWLVLVVLGVSNLY